MKYILLCLIALTPIPAWATNGCTAIANYNGVVPVPLDAGQAPPAKKGQVVLEDAYIGDITPNGTLQTLGGPMQPEYSAKDVTLRNCHVGIIKGSQGQAEYQLVLNNNLSDSDQMIINAYENKLQLLMENQKISISAVGIQDTTYDMVHKPQSACAKAGQEAINGNLKMAREIDDVCVWGKPIQ